MKTNGTIVAVLLLSLLPGCGGWRPIVDPKGTNMSNYENDLRECRGFAETVNVGGQAAAGAIGGALLGAALGAVTRTDRGMAASAGAVGGAAGGAANAGMSQIQITRNCMIERGYKVLN